MKPGDAVFTAASTAAGVWAGNALGDVPGAVVGGIVGAALGVGVARAGIRLAVAVPVLIGTLAGGVLGSSIVRALCLPGSCRGAQSAAALLTGIGSFVGVGLVVALVTRSFDEYRESRSESRDPRPDDR